MRQTPCRSALAVLVVGALGGRAGRAAPATELRDARYAHQPSAQRDAMPRRIRHIAQPALGFPALVPYGGTFDLVLVDLPSPIAATSLRVSASAGDAPEGGLRWPLRVLGAAAEAGGAHRLTVVVPADAPREVYDLHVAGPGIDETAPRALRIFGELRPDFRVVVIADHQLWDPSWFTSGAAQRYAGDYPREEKDANNAMLRQQLAEIALLDPDFVIYPGDLVFGLDYTRENEQMWQIWRKAGFATFIVPGNHDGYAGYEVKLRLGPEAAVRAGLTCRSHIGGGVDPGKLWRFLACVYGDIKPNFFNLLTQDGLAHYRRMFGPTEYAFTHGPFQFIGLNTMDGTPERRHAYSFFIEAFDLHLGAPMVDNYGGYMSPGQLTWAASVMERGAKEGKAVVAFGHHDPRGNQGPLAPTYHANLPFATDPLSLEGFKEWNYDDHWDSDPSDGRGAEKKDDHNGTRFAALLAAHTVAYVSGHVHRDEDHRFAIGDHIAGGVKAVRPMEFLRVTTAASSSMGDGYWGYRILRADGRTIRSVPFDAGRKLLSVPSGNLFVTGIPGRPQDPSRQVLSGWTQPAEARVRIVVPARTEGYRFLDEKDGELPVVEIGEAGGSQVFRVAVTVPAAARLARSRGSMRRRVVKVKPAAGNRPPMPEITVRSQERGEAPLRAGDTAILGAERTFDPDGDRVFSTIFELPDGRELRATEASLHFPAEGTFTVALRARDVRGSVARVERRIMVEPPPLPPVVGAEIPDAGSEPARVPPAVRPPAGCFGCASAPAVGSTGAPVATEGAAGIAIVTLASLALSRLRSRRRGKG